MPSPRQCKGDLGWDIGAAATEEKEVSHVGAASPSEGEARVLQPMELMRDAAGHANVSITSAYLHVAVDDDHVGELFHY